MLKSDKLPEVSLDYSSNSLIITNNDTKSYYPPKKIAKPKPIVSPPAPKQAQKPSDIKNQQLKPTKNNAIVKQFNKLANQQVIKAQTKNGKIILPIN